MMVPPGGSGLCRLATGLKMRKKIMILKGQDNSHQRQMLHKVTKTRCDLDKESTKGYFI
jgi:hypothetical protein